MKQLFIVLARVFLPPLLLTADFSLFNHVYQKRPDNTKMNKEQAPPYFANPTTIPLNQTAYNQYPSQSQVYQKRPDNTKMNKEQAPPYFANPTTIPLNQTAYNQYPSQSQGGPAPTVIISTAPQVIPRYGPNPQPTICPYCNKPVTTRVQTDPSSRTHMMAILCCIMCCLPCIPYCIDSCQNKNHFCPSCSAYLGTYDDGTMRYSRY